METCEWLLKKGRRYHCVPKTVKVTTALDPRYFDELSIATIGKIEMEHDGSNLGNPRRSATKEGRRPPSNFLTSFMSIDTLTPHMMHIRTNSIPLKESACNLLTLRIGLIACTWLCLGFAPSSVSMAATETPIELAEVTSSPNPSEEQTGDPADEPDANLVPVETDVPVNEQAAVGSEPSSRVPRAEDLLTVTPPQHSPNARFTDAFDPPAETAQTVESSGSLAGPNESYNVPIVMDSSVQTHIRYFNTSIHDRFEQWLIRLSRYRPLVENIFTEFHLPSDLVFLSLVESGFNPYAYSRAKATGPWQFMKGTAKVYGLRVDSYVDERRDPIKSTVAAARYLRDLYDLFGAWPLAMAAYNAGEGKVMRALHKAQVESFSDISKTRLIRRETKEYVPRFMAATIIAKNPDRYGFSQEASAPHRFEEVIVTRPLHFHAIANATGVPYEELRLLNPELRRDATPPGDDAYLLKVPFGTKAKVEQLLDRVPTYKFPPLPARARGQLVTTDSSRWYKVRVGDTLEKVSRRFRIPLKTLKARNNLSGQTIRAGDLLTISR
jgi:membrane-bound lytic murein transglycosylase D